MWLDEEIIMELFSRKLLSRILPVDWIQPTLTGNGTMGGSNMAVSRTFGGNNGAWGEAYTAFAPNTGVVGFYCNEWRSSMYFCIYIPKPLRANRISYQSHYSHSSSGGIYNAKLWGGNSANDRHELIKDLGTIGEGQTKDTTISTNNFYQYFTLYFENGGHSYEDRVEIKNIKLYGQYEDFV